MHSAYTGLKVLSEKLTGNFAVRFTSPDHLASIDAHFKAPGFKKVAQIAKGFLAGQLQGAFAEL